MITLRFLIILSTLCAELPEPRRPGPLINLMIFIVGLELFEPEPESESGNDFSYESSSSSSFPPKPEKKLADAQHATARMMKT